MKCYYIKAAVVKYVAPSLFLSVYAIVRLVMSFLISVDAKQFVFF